MSKHNTSFIKNAINSIMVGSKFYYLWILILALLIGVGIYCYLIQLDKGLIVTGMHDHVSWGLYISNFTFLIGLAAASVLLVLPAYILKDVDFSGSVLIGEGVAVSALITALLFVVVDMGGPERLWHLIPMIGYFNWPASMLTWDVLVVNGYLLINIFVPLYILYSHFKGKTPNKKYYLPIIFISIAWAFSIHLVTAFLYAGLSARPFWNNALLGPRFLASAFAAGPAFIILLLKVIKVSFSYPVKEATFQKLALIMTIAAQVNIVMLISEGFKEFYQPNHHSESAQYLLFGLKGFDGLTEWIWISFSVVLFSTILLSIHKIRNNPLSLTLISFILFIGVWMEKGIGLIVPGFIPSPLGEIVEYTPTLIEILISTGIFAIGALVMTLLIKVAIPIEMNFAAKMKKQSLYPK